MPKPLRIILQSTNVNFPMKQFGHVPTNLVDCLGCQSLYGGPCMNLTDAVWPVSGIAPTEDGKPVQRWLKDLHPNVPWETQLMPGQPRWYQPWPWDNRKIKYLTEPQKWLIINVWALYIVQNKLNTRVITKDLFIEWIRPRSQWIRAKEVTTDKAKVTTDNAKVTSAIAYYDIQITDIKPYSKINNK